MKKYFLFCLFFIPDFAFCDQDFNRKIKIDEKMVWEATSEVISNIGDFISDTKIDGQPGQDKKKKKRNLLKRLVKTVVNLAARLAVQEIIGHIRSVDMAVELGQSRGSREIQNKVVSLCERLNDLISNEGKNFEHTNYMPCLHCIFLKKDPRVRELEIIKELTGDNRRLFLQELLSTLFECFSEKLTDMNTKFYKQVVQQFDFYNQGFDNTFRTPQERELAEGCRICHKVATLVVGQTDVRSELDAVTLYSKMPSILRLLRVIVDVGDLATDKNNFFENYLVLIKDLYIFLKDDGLIDSLKKLSSFMDRLSSAKQEDWGELAEKFLSTPEDGAEFLEETFTNLNIYFKESLSKIFSDVFCQLSSVT